jgi:hypothetical protein
VSVVGVFSSTPANIGFSGEGDVPGRIEGAAGAALVDSPEKMAKLLLLQAALPNAKMPDKKNRVLVLREGFHMISSPR